ncbi:MAG: class I SAM-dependent methyltransferase [Nitrospiria bacterium]
MLESIACYFCGSHSYEAFVSAQDDLTGKPGDFHFVTCKECGLVYQNPRIELERIKPYYDDEYIAHRKKTDWGILTPFYNYAMNKHDRMKDKIIRNYVTLTAESEVLDVGCAAGTFLAKMHTRYGARGVGIDFKDLSAYPAFEQSKFHCGLFYEQNLGKERFNLVTMWHFLEHDYDPIRTLKKACTVLKPDGRLVIEVPRLDSLTWQLFKGRWPGLQAPQHTVLYNKKTLLRMMEKADLEVIDYLPYGSFPAYFYLFAGVAFLFLKGRGLNLSKAIMPYFIGQVLFSPILLFEKKLNLAMQTVICRRKE